MKSLVIISNDLTVTRQIDAILSNSYMTVSFVSMQQALDHIYQSIPALLIVDLRTYDSAMTTILNDLKADPIFSQIPVVAFLPNDVPLPNWDTLFVDDYVVAPLLEREIVPRVDLAIIRSERIVETNPLTRLPGNITINRQIQDRLDNGELFSLAYADLDFFKPFNDKYGFSRGDEVIKITGRLITNAIKNIQPQGSFVGHIGGDDFVFIMKPTLVEKAAQDIIDTFDHIVPTLYDYDDRQKRYIESLDRHGTPARFPLITLSIGIADTASKNFTHYGALTELASEMKFYAKQFKASCYRMDRRGPSKSINQSS